LRDRSTHQKNKPKSKAFEDFERTGIIIGYGKPPKKCTKACMDDSQSEEMESGYGQSLIDCSYTKSESGDSFLSGFSQQSLDSHSSGDLIDRKKQLNGSYEKIDNSVETRSISLEENLAEEIPRETEILTSFRRPPPPKHRSKSRNSNRAMIKSSDSNETETADLRDQTSSPIYSITEESQFEDMLRMPTLLPARAHSIHYIPTTESSIPYSMKSEVNGVDKKKHRNTVNNISKLYIKDIICDVPMRSKSDCSNKRSKEARKTEYYSNRNSYKLNGDFSKRPHSYYYVRKDMNDSKNITDDNNTFPVIPLKQENVMNNSSESLYDNNINSTRETDMDLSLKYTNFGDEENKESNVH